MISGTVFLWEQGHSLALEMRNSCLPILNFRSSPPLLSPPPEPHPAALGLLPTTHNSRQLLLLPGTLHGWIPDSSGLSSEQLSSCCPLKKPRPSSCVSSCSASWCGICHCLLSLTGVFPCLLPHLEYRPRERSLAADTDGTHHIFNKYLLRE